MHFCLPGIVKKSNPFKPASISSWEYPSNSNPLLFKKLILPSRSASQTASGKRLTNLRNLSVRPFSLFSKFFLSVISLAFTTIPRYPDLPGDWHICPQGKSIRQSLSCGDTPRAVYHQDISKASRQFHEPGPCHRDGNDRNIWCSRPHQAYIPSVFHRLTHILLPAFLIKDKQHIAGITNQFIQDFPLFTQGIFSPAALRYIPGINDNRGNVWIIQITCPNGFKLYPFSVLRSTPIFNSLGFAWIIYSRLKVSAIRDTSSG